MNKSNLTRLQKIAILNGIRQGKIDRTDFQPVKYEFWVKEGNNYKKDFAENQTCLTEKEFDKWKGSQGGNVHILIFKECDNSRPKDG